MNARRVATIALAAALGACSSSGDQSSPSTASSTAVIESSAPATTAAPVEPSPVVVELPDTPAASQLQWVFDDSATASDEDFVERFSAEFLQQVPVEQLRTAIAEIDVGAVLEIVSSSDTELTVVAVSGTGDIVVTINVDPAAPHQIFGLLAQPAELPEPPQGWTEVDAALAEAGTVTAYLAAEVADDGTLRTIRAAGGEAAVPLGSAFKLYVLGALVEAIDAGEIAWDDTLTVTAELKSLPSGRLQDLPDGSTVTVREAAEGMIQISDNTATDLLIDRLGRQRVEDALATMGLGEDSRRRTLPLITTRELFTLKWGVEPAVLEDYVAADEAGRRSILDTIGDQLPALSDFDPSTPIAIDTVEWFATPEEVAVAHVRLDEYRRRPGFEPLAGILGDNPGVPLDPAIWSEFAFKGGSEPGVVFVGWLLERNDGRTFVAILSATDENAPVAELSAIDAARGVIEQLAIEP